MILGPIEKAAAKPMKVGVNFAADMADAGQGVTISGTPGVAGAGITAAYVSHDPSGLVTVQLADGTAGRDASFTVTCDYSDGEGQVATVLVFVV